MNKVQVCVAAMKQKDLSLAEKMNIQSDLIIANQTDSFGYISESVDGNTYSLVSTTTRGVGKNRNIGLQYMSDEIIILADDDIIYKNGYTQMVSNAFDELPKADVIIFRMQYVKNGSVYEINTHKTQRVHMYNGLSFGTYQIAMKKDSILRANIHFTELFGGGCIYSSGEDSLFLIDCFRSGLKIYTHSGLLGDNIRDSSTWFNGFNDKFFYDRGAFIACAFPHSKRMISLYYLLAYRHVKELSNAKKLCLMKAGCKGYRTLQSYDDWLKQS